MKIYFCEKCGVSIPLQEVVAGQATARDGKTYCAVCIPKEAQVSADSDSGIGEDLKLYFCDNCGVSIPLQHVITNQAKTVGEKMLCTECVDLPSPQRAARRDQAEQVRKEKEESRYRLHFCDRCQTSIPQSHIVTGRSVVRGGRTYCERCKGRADRRGLTPAVLVGGLLVLGMLFLGGYLLLGGGARLFAGASTSTADAEAREDELRREIAAQLQSDLDSRIEDARRAAEQARSADEEQIGGLTGTVKRISGEFEDLKKVADGILNDHAAHKNELDRRLERILGNVLRLGEDVSALTARLEELEKRPVAAVPPAAGTGQPVRPGVEPPPPVEETPAEPPEEEAPPQVKTWIEQLSDKDAGVRFSAAVELGRAGHAGAAEPLAKVLEKDKDTFVRRAAARSLGELNAWTAVPVLIKTLEDREIFVATTAYEALKAITGQDFAFREGLSRSEVRRVVQKAREWWEKHKGDRE